MSTSHAHRHNADADDIPRPQVAGVAQDYRRELSTRLRRVRGLVRTTLVDNDALRLTDGRSNAEPADSFPYERNPDKETAFNDWFEGALDDEVLEPTDMGTVRAGRHYTGGYVRSSYRSGARWANARLRDAGVSVGEASVEAMFDAGVHRDTLESLYIRNYSGLTGITDEMGTRIGRILSEGLAAGESPRTLASGLNAEIEDLTHTRAATLARTETRKAVTRASAARYSEFGVEQVEILGYNPCSKCERAIADNPYPRDETASLCPQHPNCRCVILPIV